MLLPIAQRMNRFACVTLDLNCLHSISRFQFCRISPSIVSCNSVLLLQLLRERRELYSTNPNHNSTKLKDVCLSGRQIPDVSTVSFMNAKR